jgi:hypothetical protein
MFTDHVISSLYKYDVIQGKFTDSFTDFTTFTKLMNLIAGLVEGHLNEIYVDRCCGIESVCESFEVCQRCGVDTREDRSEGKCCHQLRLVKFETRCLVGAIYSVDPNHRVRRRRYVVCRLIERSIRRRRHPSSAHWNRE